ncbi:MAG: flagellar biosynthesis anti-sigma factor FlgM [Deltaproteobacteria bacterium]|jgi:negative regulator of flagellin synthesis FlgM|nr:flagellar biosynthesis anti-sigma factor FlgM [Deltaproteobacteria bacterium]
MISKIKGTSAQVIQQYQKSDPAKSEGDKSVTSGTSGMSVTTEKVDLSTKAKDIQRIKQILDQTPDVREAKVQELKNQIDNGTYTVNLDKIADKMVEESLIDIVA